MLSIGVIVFQFFSCKNHADINLEEEKGKILELHHLERQYHLNKMAEELVGLQTDDFTSISAGEIYKPTRTEGIAMFSDYFSAVDFESWDDITEPVIKFSDDFTVAYVTVKKNVVIRFKDENGRDTTESTEFAWVSIYKKVNNLWKMDLIASTNKARSS